MKLTRRVLFNRAKACDFQWPHQNLELQGRMLEFMRDNGGIGLAAPQIGISRRLFVMDIGGQQWACFNPEYEVLDAETQKMVEGCLSFPGQRCTITRPQTIQARWQDHLGRWQEQVMTDLVARCYQHELDHLDGITMWDRSEKEHAEQS